MGKHQMPKKDSDRQRKKDKRTAKTPSLMEQQEMLGQAALADKQTRALEELVSQHRGDYELEIHPEGLTISE